MNNTLPIVVDLTYKPQTPKSTFTPIEVDLSYPTDNNIKYDEKLSKIPLEREPMNEWSEKRNISILSPRRLSDKNSNCGLKSQMTYSYWERLLHYIWKN